MLRLLSAFKYTSRKALQRVKREATIGRYTIRFWGCTVFAGKATLDAGDQEIVELLQMLLTRRIFSYDARNTTARATCSGWHVSPPPGWP
jgi:hypothetical protein